MFQATMVILELAILEQQAQILGGIAMFDLGGLSLQHAWQISPGVAKKMVQIMVVCLHIAPLHHSFNCGLLVVFPDEDKGHSHRIPIQGIRYHL